MSDPINSELFLLLERRVVIQSLFKRNPITLPFLLLSFPFSAETPTDPAAFIVSHDQRQGTTAVPCRAVPWALNSFYHKDTPHGCNVTRTSGRLIVALSQKCGALKCVICNSWRRNPFDPARRLGGQLGSWMQIGDNSTLIDTDHRFVELKWNRNFMSFWFSIFLWSVNDGRDFDWFPVHCSIAPSWFGLNW